MARTCSCSYPSMQPNAATCSLADACSCSSFGIDAPKFSARGFFPYQGLVPVPAWCLYGFSWASPRGFAARKRKHSRQLKGLWLRRKGGGSRAEIQLLQQPMRRAAKTDGGNRREIQLLQPPMRRAAKTDGGNRRQIQLLQQLRLRVPRTGGGSRREIQLLQQPMRLAAKTGGGSRREIQLLQQLRRRVPRTGGGSWREIQLLQQPRPIVQQRGAQFCQSSRMRNLKFHMPPT